MNEEIDIEELRKLHKNCTVCCEIHELAFRNQEEIERQREEVDRVAWVNGTLYLEATELREQNDKHAAEVERLKTEALAECSRAALMVMDLRAEVARLKAALREARERLNQRHTLMAYEVIDRALEGK